MSTTLMKTKTEGPPSEDVSVVNLRKRRRTKEGKKQREPRGTDWKILSLSSPLSLGEARRCLGGIGHPPTSGSRAGDVIDITKADTYVEHPRKHI